MSGQQTFGTVKFFNQEKGYGFISTEEGDIFVHANEVAGDPLQEGDEVSFELGFDQVKQKTKAYRVMGGTGQKGGFDKGFGKGKGKGKGFGKGKGKKGGFDGGFGGGFDDGFGQGPYGQPQYGGPPQYGQPQYGGFDGQPQQAYY